MLNSAHNRAGSQCGAQHTPGRGAICQRKCSAVLSFMHWHPNIRSLQRAKIADAVALSLLQALQEMRRQGYIKGGTADCSIVGFGERWYGGSLLGFGSFCL